MSEPKTGNDEVYRFVLAEIESIPHLEALLLLWKSHPRQWAEQELSATLFLTGDQVSHIVRDLTARGLSRAGATPGLCCYASGSEDRDRLVAAVDAVYRKHLIPLSEAIHSKASAAQLARWFKRQQEQG